MAKKTMTKLEEYKAQKAAGTKAAEDFQRRIAQADEDYQALKAKHEALIRESIVSGVDKTAELDELAGQIDAAKKACERRREEQRVYSAMDPLNTITPQDVINAFNNEVIPAFKKERLEPVLERLLAAKLEYAAAVIDYHTAVSEFEDSRAENRAELAQTHYYKFNDAALNTTKETDRYFIKQADINDLNMAQMPESIKSEVKK
ncbi:hypothetical protein M3221_00370 [Domibacillus indicus]|uniref:hypothetical protein n=1 Tax=Domibacillus indicus TaxID=1437523 RepID=UPI00203E50F8|nr:hypothetical protein [Domibacillus indicus]MCM3786884.1 hypothetical protein [Domibacillus indicus]